MTQVMLSLPKDGDLTGRNFGAEELENLRQVLESGTLTCTNGTWVKRLDAAFAERLGSPYVRSVASGTAAVHTAIAAIDPEPGQEIITTSITDMGAIAPILYQGAIPIFADVDPQTYNVTADTIAPRITERTRAIIVTHLFGNPCDMGPILALAAQHNLPVIEDAAQAYFAQYNGEYVGTLGDIGCFSLQQGKHMTTGEGGFVCGKHDDLNRRMRLFVDKAWGYGDPNPDHYFLALNYRMTELQGAVAIAQLDKVMEVVQARRKHARLMDELLTELPGVDTPKTTPGATHVYWKYCLRIDPTVIRGGVDAFARALQEYGVFSAPRYIKKPAFECAVIRDQQTFGKSGFPFRGPHRDGLPPVSYRKEDYLGTYQALSEICVLPWNEFYTSDHVHQIANSVREVAHAMASTNPNG
jgi:dTDP-4-amino-4,6-dideoxygalactose transaminase